MNLQKKTKNFMNLIKKNSHYMALGIFNLQTNVTYFVYMLGYIPQNWEQEEERV